LVIGVPLVSLDCPIGGLNRILLVFLAVLDFYKPSEDLLSAILLISQVSQIH